MQAVQGQCGLQYNTRVHSPCSQVPKEARQSTSSPPPLVRRVQKWPADALAAVALKFLTEMELDANTRSKLVGLCQAMHTRITQASEGKCGEEVWGRGRGTAHA